MRRRDVFGLLAVSSATAGLIAYRAFYIEPRAWGALCVSAAPPLACLPRAGLIWLQIHYLWGAASLALGLLGFAWGGGFAAQLGAIILGVAAIENYNATWGAVGLALGVWGWIGGGSRPLGSDRKRKMFFFEKKNQKTFDRCRGPLTSTYLKK